MPEFLAINDAMAGLAIEHSSVHSGGRSTVARKLVLQQQLS